MKNNGKNIYVAPKVSVVGVILNSSLVATSYVYEDRHESDEKSFISETCCPFNNTWCCDKQKRLNEWRKAVEYFAKNRKNEEFHTCSGMFDHCPHGYTTLCAQYKQKQRG